MSAFSNAVRVEAEGVRTLAFGGISSTYADIGAVTANPIRIIMVKNTTDVAVTVSWDGGVTDVFDIPAGGADTLDLYTNGGNDGAYRPINSQFQVKDQGSAATSGKVIVQCFYVD